MVVPFLDVRTIPRLADRFGREVVADDKLLQGLAIQPLESGSQSFRLGSGPSEKVPKPVWDHRLINRMNRTQASIHHLGTGAPDMPDASGYTDVTEATLFTGLFGPKVFRVAEKLSSLDFMDPVKKAPFLLQGPFCHVPCQIVTLQKTSDGSGGFLLTCSRGYGESMVGAILEAGAEFGLRPAGEKRFTAWMGRLQSGR